MRRRLLLLGAIAGTAVVAAVAGLPAPQLPEFVSTEHKFRVRFGRDPEVTATVATGVKKCAYALGSANGARQVTVVDVPLPDDPKRVSDYLDSARDDLIRSVNGTLVSSGPTALAGDHTGLAFSARFRAPEPSLMRAHVYLVGTRLYVVMVIGTEEYANAPAATAFLDSFAVTE